MSAKAVRQCMVILLAVQPLAATPKTAKDHGAKQSAPKPQTKAPETAYSFVLPGADGNDIPMERFRGSYVLLVNLGRESTYASQLPALERLSDAYKEKGLVVIGVPSNDFGASEPGTDAEVQKYYADQKATFLVTATAKVSGEDALPLYQFLGKAKGAGKPEGVHWNYTKFVIGPEGTLLARLSPDVAPDSAEMKATIEQILSKRYKPMEAAPPKNVAASRLE